MATKDGDLQLPAESVDFLGVNYYSPLVVDGRGQPAALSRIRCRLAADLPAGPL